MKKKSATRFAEDLEVTLTPTKTSSRPGRRTFVSGQSFNIRLGTIMKSNRRDTLVCAVTSSHGNTWHLSVFLLLATQTHISRAKGENFPGELTVSRGGGFSTCLLGRVSRGPQVSGIFNHDGCGDVIIHFYIL